MKEGVGLDLAVTWGAELGLSLYILLKATSPWRVLCGALKGLPNSFPTQPLEGGKLES